MSFAPDDEQGGGTNVAFIGLAFFLLMVVGTTVWPMLSADSDTDGPAVRLPPTDGSGRGPTPTHHRTARLERHHPPAKAESEP